MQTNQRQIWWITGASSGIGRELALLLAEQGHTVYISARTGRALDALAQEHPGLLLPLPCDVADDREMAALFQSLPQPPAWLDGVILSAGVCEYVEVPDLDLPAFRRVFDVNYFGAVNACRAALPLLQAARVRVADRKPQLIGIGSLSSVVGFPRAEAYGASKAALAYFLEALRCDVQHAIDVTVVKPGFVTTPMTAGNDFPMPYAWSARRAAQHIDAQLGKGLRAISFPWQLRTLLALAAALPALWYGKVVPRLTRTRRKPQPAAVSGTESTGADT